ncbi:MAG: PepSY-like domain-containing protein [Tannerellaceae bacterium]|jgi:hypothetical protein|nr:PepSY-like domain-containing protein [Tannerellaceae bacterium]
MNLKNTKSIFFSILSLSAICLPACLPDEPLPEIKPNEEVQNTFDSRYPGAQSVAWSIEKDYYVATFTLASGSANAWFNQEGEWLLSVKEQSGEHLSHKITEAFYNSNYAAWSVEEINILERLNMGVLYVINVSEGNRRADIYYSKLGNLVKVNNQDCHNTVHYPVLIPPEIHHVIDSLFSRPEIIDLWQGEMSVNIGLLNDSSYYFVVFSATYDWICFFQDLTKEEIPRKVWDSFSLSDYGSCRVNRIQLLRNADRLLYLFHFVDEKSKRHILCITYNGLLFSMITF